MYGLAISATNNEEGTWQYLPWLWSAGGDIDTIDGPESVKALSFLRQLIDEGLMSSDVVNWTQQDAAMAFMSGQAAMCINGPWIRPSIMADAPDLNWAVAKIPMDQQYASILGGESFGIAKGSDNEMSAEIRTAVSAVLAGVSDPQQALTAAGEVIRPLLEQ